MADIKLNQTRLFNKCLFTFPASIASQLGTPTTVELGNVVKTLTPGSLVVADVAPLGSGNGYVFSNRRNFRDIDIVFYGGTFSSVNNNKWFITSSFITALFDLLNPLGLGAIANSGVGMTITFGGNIYNYSDIVITEIPAQGLDEFALSDLTLKIKAYNQ